MSKHVIDTPRDRQDGSRLEHFTAIDRTSGAEGSHVAAKTAHRTPRTDGPGTRLKQFTRIDRAAQD